jgi:putative colanic acid biosynthesis UDP-glucose lipid carrier transferase
MYKKFKYYLQGLLILFDYFTLNISFFIVLFIFDNDFSFYSTSPYLIFLLFLNISWAFISFILGGYNNKTILVFEYFIKRTIQVYILWIALVFIFLYLTKQVTFSRLFIISSLASFSFVLFFNRISYFGIKKYVKKKSNLLTKVLIIGINDAAKKLAKYFEEEGINAQLVGFVENDENVKELTNYPVIAQFDNVIQVASDLHVQEIFSTIAPEQNKYIYKLMQEAEKKCMRFKIVPNLSYFFKRPVLIDYIKDLPILSVRYDPMEDLGNRAKKRALDLIVSSFVIIFILSWLVPILGILILIESKGPIFFSQMRTGRNDKPFYCLKFRSMRVNKTSEHIQATKNDTRVTKIGYFIRKTSLDEFPQFLNVFLGDMSIVGPRPHMIKHTSDFSKMVKHYMVRQFLKPGITGWAQINSFRGEITHPNQLKLRIQSDLWYLENWNIWLDIRIIFLTFYQVFIGDKNAY